MRVFFTLEFVWFFFYDSNLFVKVFIWSYIAFLSCPSLFSWILLSFLKRIILNSFSDNSWISISLGWVIEKLGCSFGVMFPCFLMFLVTLHWCLHIWGTSHLFQPFATGISEKKTFIWRWLQGFQVGEIWHLWCRGQHSDTVSSCCKVVSAEVNLGEYSRGLWWPKVQRSYGWQWWLGLLGYSVTKAAEVLLFSFLFTGEALANDLPHGTRSGTLTEWPWCWGPTAWVHLLQRWRQCLRCSHHRDSGSWGKAGVWGGTSVA